jgi:hypothetical protein
MSWRSSTEIANPEAERSFSIWFSLRSEPPFLFASVAAPIAHNSSDHHQAASVTPSVFAQFDCLSRRVWKRFPQMDECVAEQPRLLFILCWRL